MMGVEVSRGIPSAYLRQAGAPRLEPLQDVSPGPEHKLHSSSDHLLLLLGSIPARLRGSARCRTAP